MSLKAGVAASTAAASSAIFLYVVLALISDQPFLLDIGSILIAIKPHYWAATGICYVQCVGGHFA